ncbi:MAG: hypothetical protein V3U24_02225 [Candidatus Neomarinimicrobiota bacterium]
MRRRLSPLIILFAAVISNCSDRERLNPLDPSNPETGGKPSEVTLSSSRKFISISWDHIQNSSITGYNVRRSTGDWKDTFLITNLSSEDTHVTDTIPHYDSTYSYTVTAVTETWESAQSDPATIIPGPFNYWVADFYDGTLSRVSYDGAHVLFREFTYSPIAIDIDVPRESLWVASLYPSRIVRMTTDGEARFSEILLSRPVDLAVDAQSGEVFIAMVGLSELTHLAPDGMVLDNIPCELGISFDTRLAVDPVGKTVWIAVADSQMVLRVDLESPGRVARFPVAPFPRTLSVLPGRGIVWVATDSGVVAIHEDGTRNTYLPDYIIHDLSVNMDAERIWLVVSDRFERQWSVQFIEQEEGDWEVRKLDLGTAGVFSRIRSNPGLEYPGVLVYDASGRRIVRLNSQGEVLGTLRGFSSHLDIAVEHD